MFKHNFKLNRNRKGSVLAFVLVVFLIIVVISTTVAFLFSSNLRMAVNQEENMRAHYLNLSGIDVTLSTLLSPLYVESGEDKSIIDKLRKDKVQTTLTDEIDIDGKIVGITVVYDKDEDELTITSSTTLESGASKDLSLRLEFSGNKFRMRWT